MAVKELLRCGDVITLRSGEKYVYFQNFRGVTNILVSFERGFMPLASYDSDLKNILYKGSDAWDVCKIERPSYSGVSPWIYEGHECDFETIWSRKEPARMTVAEICEALGYDVEIVKECN